MDSAAANAAKGVKTNSYAGAVERPVMTNPDKNWRKTYMIGRRKMDASSWDRW